MIYTVTTTTNRSMHGTETSQRTTNDLDTATKIFFSNLQSIHRGDSMDSHIVLERINSKTGKSRKLVTFDGYYDDDGAYDNACEKLGDLIVDEDWDWNETYDNV